MEENISQASEETTVDQEAVDKTVEEQLRENAGDSQAPEKEATEGEKTEGVESPEYNPDFKYKVHDTEYEFDERLKAIVKSQEDEQYIRELYEKSHGLDLIKPKYQSAREDVEKLKEVEQSYTDQQKAVDELRGYLKKGDFGTFFQQAGIPVDQVAEYVDYLRSVQQMTPEERRVHDQYREEQTKGYEYQRGYEDMSKKYEALETQLQDTQVRTYESELESKLQAPEIAAIAQQYDSLFEPGAFRQEIIRHGINEYHRNGQQDITMGQAVTDVYNRVSKLIGVSQQTQQTTAPSQSANVPPQEKPVIPKIRAGANAPNEKKPQTLDELREYAEKMVAN